jgi:hypothetical protein
VKKPTIVLALLVASVLAACGTRLPDEAFKLDGQLVAAYGSSYADRSLADGGDAALGAD